MSFLNLGHRNNLHRVLDDILSPPAVIFMSVRNVVVGIVYTKVGNEIKFLVLHRVWLWEGWEFPKGGLEKTDKTEESALLRELKEETGLVKVRIIEKLPYKIQYKYTKKYSEKYKDSETIQSVFLVRAFESGVSMPMIAGVKEHDDFRWLPYEDARKLLTHANQKKALDEAWKHLKGIEKIA
jgi:8-oxo-dGTP pyrophosphatase MutT (NUDIX family)